MRYLIFTLALLCTNIYAQGVERLAQKSGCLACHSVDKKVLGPAFSWVAAKYKDDPNYLTTLSNKVKNGGSGVWGPMPMPSNKQISDENITTLVTWIVTGIEPSTNPNPTTTANSSTTKSNSSSGSAVLGVLGAVAGVYLDNLESKYNSRSRNGQVSQTVPQIETRTQTSQNNYPSDSQSSSGASNSSGFLYDNYDHTRCVSVNAELDKRRLVYKNGCSYPIYMQFCQVTDDSDSYTRFQDGGRCPGGWGGKSIQANSSYNSPAWNDFNKYRFFMYACKDGWSPVNETGQSIFLINESWLCRKLK